MPYDVESGADKAKKLSRSETDALIQEIHTEFRKDDSEWRPIRDEGDIDIRYSTGNTWDAVDTASRKTSDGGYRPMLCMDETGQYTNQVVNESRANKRSINVTATGYGANDELATYRGDRIRQIEWQSNAQQAYTSLIENAVLRSFGWLRITTEYVADDSFEQDIYIRSIQNPNAVIPGPHTMPDGSDLRRLWYIEQRSHAEFKAEFPGAEIRSFTTDVQNLSNGWIRSDNVRVAEYWKTKTKRRELLLIQDQTGQHLAFADQIPKGLSPQVMKRRTVDARQVCQYITNGVEILQYTEWPEPDIPFVPCYGPVYFVQAEGRTSREIHSMLRKARHPAKMLNWLWSTEAEVIQKTPHIPWFVRKGTLSKQALVDLANADWDPKALIEVEFQLPESAMGGQPPEMPQRADYEPPIQAFEIGKESARRAIQAAMAVSPLPTQAQRRNEKSGIALKQIEDSAQKGSYHFYDHLQDSMMRCGVLVNNLIPHIDDSMKDVTLRDQADKPRIVTINDPNWQNPQTGKTEHIQPGKGRYDVTIGTGPKVDSERVAASDFADLLLSMPQLAQVLGPEKYSEILGLAVKLKNIGPLGDKISDIISPADDKQDDPRKTKEQLQKAMQALQMLQKELENRVQREETDQVKIEAKGKVDGVLKKLELDAEADLQLALQVMKDATTIRVAEINAATKGYQVSVAESAEHERQALQVNASMQAEEQGRQFEAAKMERAHQQQLEAGDVQHQQALEQGQQGHEQALEQGEQGHDQALEQGAQAAALTPQPEAGA